MTTRELFPDLGFRFEAGWCPRYETPVALAERWLALIGRLKTLDPIMSSWWDWTDLSDIRPFPSDFAELAARIAANVVRREDGTPMLAVRDGKLGEIFPYHISAHNGPAEGLEGRHDVQVNAWAGSGPGNDLPHTLDLETDNFVRAAPVFATHAMARALLLALVEVFEADKGLAMPQRLMRSWDLRHDGDLAHLFPAWIYYVGPRFVHLVRPPASALVERRPNGELLLSATAAPFDLDDTAHLDSSIAIAEGAKAFRWSSEGWLAPERPRDISVS